MLGAAQEANNGRRALEELIQVFALPHLLAGRGQHFGLQGISPLLG